MSAPCYELPMATKLPVVANVGDRPPPDPGNDLGMTDVELEALGRALHRLS